MENLFIKNNNTGKLEVIIIFGEKTNRLLLLEVDIDSMLIT